jgi:hypothetical protein
MIPSSTAFSFEVFVLEVGISDDNHLVPNVVRDLGRYCASDIAQHADGVVHPWMS